MRKKKPKKAVNSPSKSLGGEIDMEIMDSDEIGELEKDSGRKGRRLRSIQTAIEKYGKIHPEHIENGEIQRIIVSQQEYKDLISQDDNDFDDSFTSGVRSGLTNRYEIQFNFEEKGSKEQYMVIKPITQGDNKGKFEQYFKEAQKELDEQLNGDSDGDSDDGEN